MAPKRARTAAARAASSSSSSQAPGATPKLTLCGGVPHHASLVALWRDERLTDFAVSAEGVEFKAHRVALASCSGYWGRCALAPLRSHAACWPGGHRGMAVWPLQGSGSLLLAALDVWRAGFTPLRPGTRRGRD